MITQKGLGVAYELSRMNYSELATFLYLRAQVKDDKYRRWKALTEQLYSSIQLTTIVKAH